MNIKDLSDPTTLRTIDTDRLFELVGAIFNALTVQEFFCLSDDSVQPLFDELLTRTFDDPQVRDQADIFHTVNRARRECIQLIRQNNAQ